MKRQEGETPLTLGDLPDGAIDEILGRLPIKDAGRTSILSRSWRRRWQLIPDLELSGLSDPLAISHVLLLHDGPLRLFKAQSQRPLPILSCWLSTLSRRSSSTLRSLSLTLTHGSAVLSLDSLSSYFPNLTHLRLKYCSFVLSKEPLKGFPNLRSLYIKGHATDFPAIGSAFPLVEELILIQLDLQGGSLDVVAPSLRRLKLLRLEPGSFSIADAPLIETAVIELDYLSQEVMFGNSNMAAVLGAMASLKKLVLDCYILRSWAEDLKGSIGCIPARVPITLHHLRFLLLEVDFGTHQDVQFTPCLLRSCPNLEQLEIGGFGYDPKPLDHIGKAFWEAQEHVDLLDRLETVKMTLMVGIENELELMQFLLARALRLKTMMINFSEASKKEIAMAHLLEFPRASHQARIILIDQEKMKKLSKW